MSGVPWGTLCPTPCWVSTNRQLVADVTAWNVDIYTARGVDCHGMDKQIKQFAVMAIGELGGSSAVAELLGIDERVVSNWPARGLPPDTYAALAPLLTKLGREAPPVMWRQRMLIRKRVKRPPRPKRNGNGKRR